MYIPSRAGATADGASTAGLVRTARMTGLFHLGMAIVAMLGYLVIRPRLFAADDPSATLANLVGNESLATAVEVAFDPVGDAPATVYLMYLVSGNLWGVGGMFFGLWLIPMGLCVLRSGWMPRPLGWLLIGGGVGYLLGAFIVYLAPEARVVAELIAVPAHIGEFWMVGYLLVRDIRRRALQETPRDDARMEQLVST